MQERLTPNECLTSSLFWPLHLRSSGVPQLHAPSAPALPLPPDEDSWILCSLGTAIWAGCTWTEQGATPLLLPLVQVLLSQAGSLILPISPK